MLCVFHFMHCLVWCPVYTVFALCGVLSALCVCFMWCAVCTVWALCVFNFLHCVDDLCVPFSTLCGVLSFTVCCFMRWIVCTVCMLCVFHFTHCLVWCPVYTVFALCGVLSALCGTLCAVYCLYCVDTLCVPLSALCCVVSCLYCVGALCVAYYILYVWLIIYAMCGGLACFWWVLEVTSTGEYWLTDDDSSSWCVSLTLSPHNSFPSCQHIACMVKQRHPYLYVCLVLSPMFTSTQPGLDRQCVTYFCDRSTVVHTFARTPTCSHSDCYTDTVLTVGWQSLPVVVVTSILWPWCGLLLLTSLCPKPLFGAAVTTQSTSLFGTSQSAFGAPGGFGASTGFGTSTGFGATAQAGVRAVLLATDCSVDLFGYETLDTLSTTVDTHATAHTHNHTHTQRLA